MDYRRILEDPKANYPAEKRRFEGLSIICFILCVVFLVLTLILHYNSSVKVDERTAKVMGIEYVANIQATIYATGCGIISAIFLVSGFILLYLSEIGKR